VTAVARRRCRLASAPRGYAAALSNLREATRAPAGLNATALLIRVAALNPHVATVLLRLPLRTRDDRRGAVIAAAIALAEGFDDETESVPAPSADRPSASTP